MDDLEYDEHAVALHRENGDDAEAGKADAVRPLRRDPERDRKPRRGRGRRTSSRAPSRRRSLGAGNDSSSRRTRTAKAHANAREIFTTTSLSVPRIAKRESSIANWHVIDLSVPFPKLSSIPFTVRRHSVPGELDGA